MSTSSIVRFETEGPAVRLERWGEPPNNNLETEPPVRRGHSFINDTEHGLTAGIWECTAFTTNPGPYPVNEFMLVLKGEVTIVQDGGRETTIRAGESFVMPKGLHCQWKQTGYLLKYFVRFDHAPDSKPVAIDTLQVLRPDLSRKLTLSTPPDPELLLSAVPVQHAYDLFSDPTGQWSVGVSDTTAYHHKAIPFPRNELMHILEGSVTLTDGTGKAHHFSAGDTFFVPLGTVCDWKCEGYLKKLYCIFQPRAAVVKTEAQYGRK